MKLTVRRVTLVLNESKHRPLYIRHAQNLYDLWPFLLVLHKQLRDEIFHVLRVHVRQWPLFVLDNFKYESKEVLPRKSMLQSAELVKNAAKRPNIRRVVIRLRLAYLWGHVVRCPLNGKRKVIDTCEDS